MFIVRQPTQERGVSRFPFLLLLALTAAIVYIIAVFVPVYQGQQQMHAAAEEIVHRGARQKLSDDDVRAQLHEMAREHGLPEGRRIELWREGRTLTAQISYTQRVQFPFYKYEWPVQIRVQDFGL
jgi:hypothetical protein